MRSTRGRTYGESNSGVDVTRLTKSSSLCAPHGGALSSLIVPAQDTQRIREESLDWPSIDLSLRQTCDLELLLNGAFSPLTGFLTRRDYDPVLRTLRLADGAVWPMPITLNVSTAVARTLEAGKPVGLRDAEGSLLAVLDIEDIWQADWRSEAQHVFGSTDPVHPGVQLLQAAADDLYVGGSVRGLALPRHYDFRSLRRTPAELRAELEREGWSRVVAFQTRNPMHRAHKELTERAARETGAHLLLHPSVGMTKPGDVDHFTRVRCYEAIASEYPAGLMKLSLLNLAMRMGGPREALWHAIIRKNHGCSHFIVGRDHAGPGNDGAGRPFYGPYAAQDLVREHEREVGVTMVPFHELVYVPGKHHYFPSNEIPAGEKNLNLSGTELRQRLRDGREIPEWFTYPSVVSELRRAYPPKVRQGVTLLLTGLSGAGKSTIANILLVKLLENGARPVSLLDGDLVRRTLSAGLGFSKADRDTNILRIALVAAEITKHHGIAICAPIAPYAGARQQMREWVSAHGAFVEVHVATPIEVCEQRDRKGLYAKARAGQLPHFTGIDDPYEVPSSPEIRLDTVRFGAEECAQQVLEFLQREGFLS